MWDFVNYFILSYSISLFKLNGNACAPSPATRTDEYRNTDFASAEHLGAILDEYLGREELEELILEGGNVFDNDLPRTLRIDVFVVFQ